MIGRDSALVCRGFQDRDGELEGPKLVEDILWKLRALASAGKSVNGATRRKYLDPIEAMAVPSMSHFHPEQLLELILIYGNLREKVCLPFPFLPGHDAELNGGIQTHTLTLLGPPLFWQPSEEMCTSVEAHLVECMHEYGADGITTIVQGFAKMQLCPSRRLLESLERRSERVIDGFTPAVVANTLWAYAKLGVQPGGDFLSILREQASYEMGDFSAGALSKTMWSLGKLNLNPGQDFVCLLEEQAIVRIGDFDHLFISKMLWAYATLGIRPGKGIVDCLQARALSVVCDFNPQSMAMALWGFATIGVEPRGDLMAAMQLQVKAAVAEFTPQTIAMVTWSWATLKVRPTQGNQIKSNQTQMNPMVYPCACMLVDCDASLCYGCNLGIAWQKLDPFVSLGEEI
jgi:hypothetical protein